VRKILHWPASNLSIEKPQKTILPLDGDDGSVLSDFRLSAVYTTNGTERLHILCVSTQTTPRQCVRRRSTLRAFSATRCLAARGCLFVWLVSWLVRWFVGCSFGLSTSSRKKTYLDITPVGDEQRAKRVRRRRSRRRRCARVGRRGRCERRRRRAAVRRRCRFFVFFRCAQYGL
jgi:hypothetical protein